MSVKRYKSHPVIIGLILNLSKPGYGG